MRDDSTLSEDAKRRADGLRKLANKLGCVSPMYICDVWTWQMMGEPCLNPILLEKWLAKKYHYDTEGDESIKDCMERLFGKKWADLAESLI